MGWLYGSLGGPNLLAAFGNLSLAGMRFYTVRGLNIKITIGFFNFYFYFTSKHKLTPKPVYCKDNNIPQLFQIFNFTLIKWKV